MFWQTQDLFNPNISQSVSEVTSQQATIVSQSTSQNSVYLYSIDLNNLINNFNTYAIIWSVFVSFMFVSDFYYYFILYSNDDFAREKLGVKSIWSAMHVWERYLVNLILVVITFNTTGTANNIFAILTFISFAVKFYFDLLEILSISSYFPWFSNFSKNLSNFLQFYKIKSAKKTEPKKK
jgi:hypothetical protein